MKFKFITPILLFALAGATSFYFIHKSKKAENSKEAFLRGSEENEQFPKAYMLEEMYKQWDLMQRDPATGRVPKERLLKAWDYTNNLQQAQKFSKVSGGIANVKWTNRGPSNVGGRTRALMVSPNDASMNTAFAGSVGGGIWRCNNLKSSTPVWEPVNDLLQNLAISYISFDPTDTQIFYAGTGEGFGNSDAARGLGIMQSIDGGVSWSFLSSTQTSDFYYVNKVIVSAEGFVFAATRSGIFRSKNKGISWEKVLSGSFADLEVNNLGVLYAGGLSSGLYRSPSGDSGSWINLSTAGIGLPSSSIRIETAIAPNNSSVVYVLIYQLKGFIDNQCKIYRSVDNGASFTEVASPADADTGIKSYDFTRKQGWYDLILKVDPNNSDVIYTGGIDIFKSQDGGTTWNQITHWYGGFGFQYVHADQHGMEFEGTNSDVLYFTNDGGIAQTMNATAPIPTIKTINTNYAVTQFYALALNPTIGSNNFLAGAQDNGTQQFTTPGFGATSSAIGGDGAYCNIDQLNPQFQFGQYVYNNHYRSSDGGSLFQEFSPTSLDNNGRFINPTDYDPLAKTLFAASGNAQYVRWVNATTSSTFKIMDVSNMDGQVSAVTVSSITANKVYFGTGNGQIIEVNNATLAASPVTGRVLGKPVLSGYLNNIWEDPSNGNHLIIVYSGYGVKSVWETFNANVTTPVWVSRDGNLPDMPIYWVLPSPDDIKKVMVATELGIFSTDNFDNAAPDWAPTNDGLANVRVTQIRLRKSDKLVVASTHGRGLFTTDVYMQPAAYFAASKKVAYTGNTINFKDASAKPTSWQWDLNGDGTFDSNDQNTSFTYEEAGTYTVKLRINNNPLLETTYTITVLPKKGTPYLISDGGDFETNAGDFAVDNTGTSAFYKGKSIIDGKSGTRSGNNAWVIDIDKPVYSSNSTAWLYTPEYNCTATGEYTISFYAEYDVENEWDGFRVEYSLDKGSSWLHLGNSVQPNWYDYLNPEGNRPFPQGQFYFSKTDLGVFTLCTFTTSEFQGQPSVAFRIVFKSDPLENFAGLAVDDFSVTGPENTTLPVKLVSFTGNANGNNNILNWKTSSEINSNRYEVERSFDGRNFERIASVKSFNNPSGHIYTLSDNVSLLNLKLYYYRLKMVDNDGKYSYSPVINISRAIIKEKISLLGNPVRNNLKLAIPLSLLQQRLTAEIVGTGGTVVLRGINLTLSTSSVNISPLPAGTYFIRFNANNKLIQSEKFIKQ